MVLPALFLLSKFQFTSLSFYGLVETGAFGRLDACLKAGNSYLRLG